MVKEEDRLKVLQVEKRLVDLELSIEEIKKKLDSGVATDLEQRLGDVEDLVMVENAGVIELKNMLEKMGAEPQEAPSGRVNTEELQKVVSSTTAELDKKISKIESELSSLKEEVGKPTPEIPEMKKDIGSITKEITDFEADVGKEIRKMNDEIKAAKYSPDVQFLTSKVNAIKNAIGDFESKRTDLELKIGTLERSVIEMSTSAKLSKPDELVKELETHKEVLNVTNRRIDSLEDSIRSLNQTVSEKVKKLDAQNIKETLEAAGNISNLLNDVRTAHGEIKNKLLEIDKLTPATLDGRVSKLEERLRNAVAEMRLDVSRSVEELRYSYDSRFSSLEHDVKIAEMQPPQEGLDTEINDLIEKIVFLESRMTALEKVLSKPKKVEPVILE